METFRSEYSEDGLSTSRFGGSNSSSASLSFVSQSGSFDSRSARSDFLNTYEHKFQARKAEKKKKKEREAAKSNQVSSTEEKWRAEREADRAARKREMETWIPQPAALKRIERDSKKRSRERMKSVLSWYPPSSGGVDSQVHPQFVMQSTKRERVLTDQERAAEEDARRAMANGLQRRADDLRLKVTFIEHQILSTQQACDSPAKVSCRQAKHGTIRQRRPGREQLTPLRDGHEDGGVAEIGTQLALTRSVSHDSMGIRDLRPPSSESGSRALRNSTTISSDHRRFAAGVSGSKSVSHLPAVGEDDDADDAEMEQFLLLHRRQVRCSRIARQ